MTMLIRVEGVNHETLARFGDDHNAFFRLTERIRADAGDEWRVLPAIHLFDDTMINRFQQGWLREELAKVRQRPELLQDAGPMVERIMEAVDRVWEDGGYLTFIGE